MFDLTIQQVLFRVAALLVLAAVHGFALAGMARLLGDRGVGYDGKLTFNPLAHLDLLAVVATIFARVGWIPPVTIDPNALRLGRTGLAVCAIGALAVTLGAVLLVYQARRLAIVGLPESLAIGTVAWMHVLAETGIVFVLANVLPLPPFTGRLFLQAAAPEAAARVARATLPIALVVTALCVSGLAGRALAPLVNPLLRWLLA